jgi:hypothetical protein
MEAYYHLRFAQDAIKMRVSRHWVYKAIKKPVIKGVLSPALCAKRHKKWAFHVTLCVKKSHRRNTSLSIETGIKRGQNNVQP